MTELTVENMRQFIIETAKALDDKTLLHMLYLRAKSVCQKKDLVLEVAE